MKKRVSVCLVVWTLLILFACGCIRRYADSSMITLPSEQNDLSQSSSFTVHYIDVGQADSALILCDNAAMMIDGGNKEDSSLVFSYLNNLGINHLDYIVCTHPHEDHIGGLPATLNVATVDHALCPVTEYDSDQFLSFSTYLEKQNVPITVPKQGDTFTLGSASVQVLGPETVTADLNNSSIVLRVTYGDTSFLFMGDAEFEEEQSILNYADSLQSTVLKVGHHGSANSTTYQFLYEAMPQYAVISVGTNNPYGHPTEEALSRLRDADVTVYRTDLQGDVICTSDGTTVTFEVERNPDADTLAAVGPNSIQAGTETGATSGATEYVLNTNSHKFHYLECPAVAKMSEKNKGHYQGSRDEVIAMGYDPCGWCNP